MYRQGTYFNQYGRYRCTGILLLNFSSTLAQNSCRQSLLTLTLTLAGRAMIKLCCEKSVPRDVGARYRHMFDGIHQYLLRCLGVKLVTSLVFV